MLKTPFNYHWLQEAFLVKVRLNDFNFNLRMYTTMVSLFLAVFNPRKTHAQNTHITASYLRVCVQGSCNISKDGSD